MSLEQPTASSWCLLGDKDFALCDSNGKLSKMTFGKEVKILVNGIRSHSKDVQAQYISKSNSRHARKLSVTQLTGSWKLGFWNRELSEIQLFRSNWRESSQFVRKATKDSYPSPKKNLHCFHQNLGDAVLASSYGEFESIQRESNLPTLRRFSEVKEENRSNSSAPPLSTESDILLAHYVPVYVMLPLDVISNDNVLGNVDFLNVNLRSLKAAHVDGLMVDVWWGIVEAAGPKQFDWSAYRSLFQLITNLGFKLQVIMSFHQCGGNVGDSCYIPLPGWVREEGKSDPDIFFTNRDGKRNEEYLSFGIDDKPVLKGRTAVEVYSDFMRSFRENMRDFLESGMITEIEVGLGPAGELRYPSFTDSHGWHFPGIGEFQCYDKYLLSDLKEVANKIGQIEWGYSGPQDAGHYNDWPMSTGFFCNHGTFTTDYGRFFLEWYSNVLLKHGDMILEAASNAFVGCTVKLATKIAGIHWWYDTRNHAAELAAGYYNLRGRDGYKPIAKMLSRHRAILNFTCIEMRDDDHYWEARCGPEGLARQVLNAGWNEGIEVSCENALPRYDKVAFDQIIRNARPDGISKTGPPKNRISSFTYLRLCQDLMQENKWREFNRFVRHMHAGLDYHPEPEKYFRPRAPLRRSKPMEVLQEAPVIPVASVPLDHHYVPLAPKMQLEPFFSQDAPGGGLGVQVGEISAPMSRRLNLLAWLWRKAWHVDESSVVENGIEAPFVDHYSDEKEFPGFLL